MFCLFYILVFLIIYLFCYSQDEIWKNLFELCQINNDNVVVVGDDIPTASVGQWYHISDHQVTSVTEKQVLNANAYVTFYEKMI